MIVTSSRLFSEVKDYIKLRKELQVYLSGAPHNWPKFQKSFFLNLDKIYADILTFERENTDKLESKVYRLKNIFEKRYRRYFLCGEFIKWAYQKPFGYPGDFKIIDGIYQNEPRTTGFDRLWDNYFQQLATSKAVRERKEDLKRIIFDFVNKHRGKSIRIMSLASGPAREIKELIDTDSDNMFSRIFFDCYDFEIKAIDYAKQLLNGTINVNFFLKNAIRLALKKDITKEIPYTYDLIYSAGLFDYLDERVAVRLVGNLKKLLRKNGLMVIANFGDKFSNASVGWMEWVADWYLIYRTEDEFRKIFIAAGFPSENLQVVFQSSKIIQSCFARND